MATGGLEVGSIEIEEGGASAATAPTKIKLYKETGSDRLLVRTSSTVYDVATSGDYATAAQIEAGTAEKVLTADMVAASNHWRTKYGGRVTAYYDFAVQGGSTGTINLIRPDGAVGEVSYLPNKSRITNAYLFVKTAATSGGAATLSFGVANDHTAGLLAATAVASFTVGIWMQLIPDTVLANFTTISTAQRNLILTIGAASLTAGQIIIFADYVTTP